MPGLWRRATGQDPLRRSTTKLHFLLQTLRPGTGSPHDHSRRRHARWCPRIIERAGFPGFPLGAENLVEHLNPLIYHDLIAQTVRRRSSTSPKYRRRKAVSMILGHHRGTLSRNFERSDSVTDGCPGSAHAVANTATSRIGCWSGLRATPTSLRR